MTDGVFDLSAFTGDGRGYQFDDHRTFIFRGYEYATDGNIVCRRRQMVVASGGTAARRPSTLWRNPQLRPRVEDLPWHHDQLAPGSWTPWPPLERVEGLVPCDDRWHVGDEEDEWGNPVHRMGEDCPSCQGSGHVSRPGLQPLITGAVGLRILARHDELIRSLPGGPGDGPLWYLNEEPQVYSPAILNVLFRRGGYEGIVHPHKDPPTYHEQPQTPF